MTAVLRNLARKEVGGATQEIRWESKVRDTA
jgi:hypothetical protein